MCACAVLTGVWRLLHGRSVLVGARACAPLGGCRWLGPEFVGQNDKEVQLHILTCRPLHQLENLMAEVIQLERLPTG